MKTVHGGLVLDYIAADPENAPRRYVQNHVFDGTRADGDPAASMLAIGIDFVTEVTFADAEAARASRETAFYREHLLPDEARMVDTARVLGGPFLEAAVVGVADPAANIKVFGLIGAPPGGDREALRMALAAASATISSAVLRRCCHISLAPTPIDTVETFWFRDTASAQTFAESYVVDVIEPLRREGLASPAMSAIALATEYVLHAGA
eukprot:gene21201-27464_t